MVNERPYKPSRSLKEVRIHIKQGEYFFFSFWRYYFSSPSLSVTHPSIILHITLHHNLVVDIRDEQHNTIVLFSTNIIFCSRYCHWMRARRPRCWSSSPGRVKNFHFTSSRPALGPIQPHNQWVPEGLSPGVKRLEREADHSPPTSAEVKKMWIYTSTPPYAFMT
jgi:hypothetical protein